ncbi:MAG: M50 family metallopeptidase [Faecousia sp.]
MTIFSILFGIFLFSLLIFIHELGHFIAAKSFGVQVNEFSMFMGPVLWKKQKGETLYSIRLIPIGGFCEMEGENGDSDNPRSFTAAAWWKRLVILVAGPFMNLLAGLLLFLCFFAPQEQYIVPVVDHVERNSAIGAFGKEEGIRKGDRILEVDGEKIYMYNDFELILTANTDKENNPQNRHDLVLLRNGERIELKNFAMQKRNFQEEDGSSTLRYGFSFGSEKRTFTGLLKQAWNASLSNIRMVRISLKMLLTGKAGLKDMSGPVGIVQMMSETSAKSSSLYYAFLNMLSFGGLISVNLGIMNLLPIPALDGGRSVGVVLTALVEGITRKKINPKYEGYIHGAGMIVLFALMGLIMFKDIFVIIKG